MEVRNQNPPQRALIEHDHMVETFTANGTNHSLYVGSLPG